MRAICFTPRWWTSSDEPARASSKRRFGRRRCSAPVMVEQEDSLLEKATTYANLAPEYWTAPGLIPEVIQACLSVKVT